ncbi:hypothetical protein SAMN05443667_101434 [Flavobacterium gillisiae]|uniref:GTP-binding protein n=1 Tax=Flavobacterium gillisiae TaxID=150146 RepID=A0A1H3X9F8_9FLAO|nr:hypothetical protein [Flavobacterium gillisiae]SDZ95989.1 hypothetical protein SAMN05443667_101434 [Flavobacterium gillisiae]
MDTNNELRLRLRFYKDVPESTATVLQKFENYKKSNCDDFSVKTGGTHIWLNIKDNKKSYYSPHLHLELEPKNENETHIRGLFGPDPTLWTFFMFLHFIIAGLFLTFSGIAYSDYVLKNSMTFDFIVIALMVFSWFLLYFIAKQIRENGHDQMNELETLFLKILAS